jgi:flavorubredoxin
MSSKPASVAEIAPDIYRIATYHEPWRCSINQYVILDDEPTLVSTGFHERFEDTRAGIAEILDPKSLRHVVVPHFESDECGALNEFLALAPDARPVASMRAALASLADFAVRAPRTLGDGETLDTGHHGLRILELPYVHAWDGIVLADDQSQVVFSADLFIQPGLCDAVSQDDRSALSVQLYRTFYGQPPPSYLLRALDQIEALEPALLAPGHGSALRGNLAPYFRALRALAGESFLGRPSAELAAAR